MSETIESTLNEVASLPEESAAIESPESRAVKAEAKLGSDARASDAAAELLEKKESGEKLTKTEEKKLKEYELKVNGRVERVKFDPNNDEEVKNWLQKARSSDSKFQEAAEVRKAAMQFIDDLKKNPRRVLSDPNIGVDLKKFAEEIMNDQIAEMEKSPEVREKEALQKELQKIKEERDAEKKASDAREMARIQAEHERNLESEMSVALDISGLPKTPRTVKHMAEMMIIAMQNGIELSAKEIAPIIKNTTLKEFKDVVNSLTDDQLDEFLGKEVLGRMSKRRVAKAKAIDTANTIKSVGEIKKSDKSEEPAKKMTIRDFLKA